LRIRVFLFIEISKENRRGASFPTFRGDVSRLFYWFRTARINGKPPPGAGELNGPNIDIFR
jgi:hypothetical protein